MNQDRTPGDTGQAWAQRMTLLNDYANALAAHDMAMERLRATGWKEAETCGPSS